MADQWSGVRYNQDVSLILGNWKSNKTRAAAGEWIKTFAAEWRTHGSVPDSRQVVLAPPYYLLAFMADAIQDLKLPISLGVQDISQFGAGKYTGAVAAVNLREYGVTHVILGHSERRQYFHETHQEVAAKVDQALDNEMIPVVCVDESYWQEQVEVLGGSIAKKCAFAFEPLSAIGTGQPASVGLVAPIISQIKNTTDAKTVIYGGSVTAETVAEYLLVSDGVLPGAAALDAKSFADLIWFDE